jgi:iron complex transport system substrate-binding protein
MLGYAPNVLSLNAVNLEQVFADIEQVSQSAGVADRAADRLGSLRERLDLVRQRSAGAPQPRVLCMEWLDPPYCAGHWIPEMVELAGGKDELGFPAGPSREVTWRDVADYAPEVLILMPCSLSLERVASEFDGLRGQAGWDRLPAVQARRVYVGHTDLFSRSGPRLVDGVETLAHMLHPECFEQALPDKVALRISSDGQSLEAYR